MNRRYFKVPWTLPEYGKGFWYGEYSGEWISRQVIVLEKRILVGGIDTKLGDVPLQKFEKAHKDTGAALFEITAEEFEEIWQKYVEEPDDAS